MLGLEVWDVAVGLSLLSVLAHVHELELRLVYKKVSTREDMPECQKKVDLLTAATEWRVVLPSPREANGARHVRLHWLDAAPPQQQRPGP